MAKIRLFLVFIAAAGAAFGQTQVRSQQDVNEQILSELKSLHQELGELRSLVQKQPVLPRGVTGAPAAREEANQKVTLPFVPAGLSGASGQFVVVEFTDMQCPFCNHFEKATLPSLRETLSQSRHSEFTTVEFPLNSHPNSFVLSVANLCAANQDRYQQMRRELSAHPSQSPEEITKSATRLGMDGQRFRMCLDSQEEKDVLKGIVEQAQAAGVHSTPTFLIGQLDNNGRVSGRLVVGDMSETDFLSQFDQIAMGIKGEQNEASTKTNGR